LWLINLSSSAIKIRKCDAGSAINVLITEKEIKRKKKKSRKW
jgi:hypothetical protein